MKKNFLCCTLFILTMFPVSFAYGFDANDAREHLEDRFLGDPNAPITIYEYSSFTCPYCAKFHATAFLQLRKNYIDTGKVKLVYRDFPIDRPAVFAALLSRCIDPENIRKYYGMIDVLFRDQKYWVVGEESDYLKKLRIIGRRAGLTNQQVRDCRNSQPFVDLLLEKRYRYEVQLNIISTPTFIFNNNERRLVGAQPYEVFRVTIEDLLQKHGHIQEMNEESNSSSETQEASTEIPSIEVSTSIEDSENLAGQMQREDSVEEEESNSSSETQEVSTEDIPSTEVSTSIEDSENLAGQIQREDSVEEEEDFRVEMMLVSVGGALFLGGLLVFRKIRRSRKE